MMNTLSDEGIAQINASSRLVLRRQGDYAVEFLNAAGRLYVLYFIELVEMGDHRVFYFWLRLAEGKRGGAADKDTGRMIVSIISQYLEEHPDDLVCYCHFDNDGSNAINRIFHLWARTNKDVFDGKISFFDGVGKDAQGKGLHFMVIYHMNCRDLAELKATIQESSSEFAVAIREQLNLLRDVKLEQLEKEKK